MSFPRTKSTKRSKSVFKVAIPLLSMPLLMTGCLSSKSGSILPSSAKSVSDGGAKIANIITTGFALPASIETVPNSISTNQSSMRTVSSGNLDEQKPMTTVNALSSDLEKTDMEKDTFTIRIWEKDLDQFQIIDQLLSALKQTRYEDALFLNKGPYGTLIRWDEDNKIEKWVVDSKIVTIDDRVVNQVDFWIQEKDGLIEARFNIFAPATALNRYGEWTAQAKMYTAGKTIRGQFSANTSMNSDGQAIVRVHHENMGDHDYKFRGKLVIKDDAGSGIFDNGTEMFNYAYNTNHLLVKKSDEEMSCKSRNDYEDFTLDYNVYTADGMNIKNTKKFGFPLKLQGEENSNKYYYYGAYHNRHGLYTNNNEAPPAVGSIMLRSDDNKKETYSYYGRHSGYLSKKIISPATQSDIMFQLLASHTNDNFNIRYSAAEMKFFRCDNNQINCSEAFDMDQLKSDPKLRRQVRVYSWNGEVDPQFLMPMEGQMYWVSIDQPLYLEFDGNQWVQWSYEFQENSTDWLPKLLEKSPYTFSKSQTYFIQAQDFGYEMQVMVEDGLTSLSLKQFSEHVVLPGSESLAAAKLLFKDKWSQEEFSFDSASMDLMNGEGNKVTDGKWQLEGSDGETYQWVYSSEAENNYASVDYLMDVNNEFVFLDEAIYFASFELNNKMMTSLGYDGHMRGLPNYYSLLRDSNGDLTDEIRQKIVNIPYGLYRDRQNADLNYFIKPIRGIRVLAPVSSKSCTVGEGQPISLDDQDSFQDFKLGDYQDLELKVVEGSII